MVWWAWRRLAHRYFHLNTSLSFEEADHDWLSGCNSSMHCVHVWQDYNASIKVEHNLHDHNLQQTESRSSQNWPSAFGATPSAQDFCEMPEEHFSGNSGDVGFEACNTCSLGIRPSQQAPRSDGQMRILETFISLSWPWRLHCRPIIESWRNKYP